MNEFIEYIVKNLVDSPEKVEARIDDEQDGVVIQLRVDPADLGKVIGRKGNTIKALRSLMSVVCARLGRRCRIDLVE